jgi:hypothetical protein
MMKAEHLGSVFLSNSTGKLYAPSINPDRTRDMKRTDQGVERTLGILIVPTRWFWDGTLRDFHEMRFKTEPYVAFDARLGRTRLVVFNDGYVALDTSNRQLAAARLKALFLALGLVTGRTTESVTERSLEEVEIKNGGRERKRWNMLQLANFIETYPTSPVPGLGLVHIRKEMENHLRAAIFGTEELGLAVNLANRFIKTGRPAAVAQHLETINHFVAGDWMASALLGWITIEQAIDNELVLQLTHEGLSLPEAQKRMGSLTEYWVIEELKKRSPLRIGRNDPTVLTKAKLAKIHGLRKLRNSIVHESRRATRRDALRMKDGSEMAMWRMFRHNKFSYAELFQSVSRANRAREKRLWTFDAPS